MNMHIYLHTYIHIYIYTYTRTYIHTYLHTCIKLCCGLFHIDRNIFQLDRSMGQDLTQADCQGSSLVAVGCLGHQTDSLWCMLLAMTGLSRWRPWGPGDMMGCRCGTTRSSLFAPCLNHKKLTANKRDLYTNLVWRYFLGATMVTTNDSVGDSDYVALRCGNYLCRVLLLLEVLGAVNLKAPDSSCDCGAVAGLPWASV